ncbi:MAG: DUF1822 family protein [Okeania sp. SIO2C9]|uniref:DUF1822 family protein n=1 Tax=Okeania sp. SIO2C9 TaxID=2607791 RepID=UPI0013C21287|nr:DUF1822 family protein [Okeania sp. SIO2C9]NEQ74234.1 DUF1822 family protein [Okeania sp. SIO2C9]
MNNYTQLRPVIVPLDIKIHQKASALAAQQSHPEIAKQVYLNILAVSAVSHLLKWLEFETNLEQTNSFNPLLSGLFNATDLIVENRQLFCMPILPGETDFYASLDIAENFIGYVAVQFQQSLDKVEILGFYPAVKNDLPEKISLAELQPLDNLFKFLEKNKQEVLPQNPLVNLGNWFAGIFEAIWLSPEAVLTPKLGFAKSSSVDTVKRAKIIDFGLLLNRQKVALVVTIQPELDAEVGVLVQVYPIDEQEYLPPGLRLKIELESDIEEVESRVADQLIQLEFSEIPGKCFSVKVILDDGEIVENFLV